MVPPLLAGTGQDSQPEVPHEQPAGGEPTARADLVVLSPTRQCAGRVASEPDPQGVAGSSSLSHDWSRPPLARQVGRQVVRQPR